MRIAIVCTGSWCPSCIVRVVNRSLTPVEHSETHGLHPATVAALVMQVETHAGILPSVLFWAKTDGETKVAASKTSLNVDAIMAIIWRGREGELS